MNQGNTYSVIRKISDSESNAVKDRPKVIRAPAYRDFRNKEYIA